MKSIWFATFVGLLAVQSAGARAPSRKLTRAQFVSLATPSKGAPIYILSEGAGSDVRVRVYLGAPCSDPGGPDRYVKGEEMIYTYKSPAGLYSHLMVCTNGSPWYLETHGGLAEVARLRRALAAGPLIDTDGDKIPFQAFGDGPKYFADYYEANDLHAVWWARAKKSGIASPVAAGPKLDDILSQHAKWVAESYGGRTTSRPGEIVYPSPFGGAAYYERRLVAGHACSKIRTGVFRCDYSLLVTRSADPNSLYGSLQTAFMKGIEAVDFRYTYEWRNGWVSDDLAKAVRADAAAARQRTTTAADDLREFNSRQREQEQKQRDCLNQALNERRMAFCTYY